MTRTDMNSNWERNLFLLILLVMLSASFFSTCFFAEKKQTTIQETHLPDLPYILNWDKLELNYPVTESQANPFVVTFTYEPPPPPPPVVVTPPPPPPPPPPPKKTVHITFRGIYTNTQDSQCVMIGLVDDKTGETKPLTIVQDTPFADGFILKDASETQVRIAGPDGAEQTIKWNQTADFTFEISQE